LSPLSLAVFADAAEDLQPRVSPEDQTSLTPFGNNFLQPLAALAITREE
jgi:hypothetical protein